MSDLETLRAHARVMAARDHLAGPCPTWAPAPGGIRGALCGDALKGLRHQAHQWEKPLTNNRDSIRLARWCHGHCTGCMTDRDRAMWRQIADEVDAYLTTDDGQETLL